MHWCYAYEMKFHLQIYSVILKLAGAGGKCPHCPLGNPVLDILSINETMLDSSISNNEINMSGYDVVRTETELVVGSH